MFYRISQFYQKTLFSLKTLLLPQSHVFTVNPCFTANHIFITISHFHKSQSDICKGSWPLSLYRRDIVIASSIVRLTCISNALYFFRIALISLIPISHRLPLYVKPSPLSTPDAIFQSLIASFPQYRYRSLLSYIFKSPLSPCPLPIRYYDFFSAVGSALAWSNGLRLFISLLPKNDRSYPVKHESLALSRFCPF